MLENGEDEGGINPRRVEAPQDHQGDDGNCNGECDESKEHSKVVKHAVLEQKLREVYDETNDADDEDEDDISNDDDQRTRCQLSMSKVSSEVDHPLPNANQQMDCLRRSASLKERREAAKLVAVDLHQRQGEPGNKSGLFLHNDMRKTMVEMDASRRFPVNHRVVELKESNTDIVSLISYTRSRRRLSPAIMRKAQSNDLDLGLKRRQRERDRAKMVRVEPGLFLGNMEAATDTTLLAAKHITHILSLDSVPPPKKIHVTMPHIQHLHLQLTDLEDEDLLSSLPSALSFIESALSSDKGQVLVHCFRGKSRSASVVIAHLMRNHRLSLDRALRRVRERRPVIAPHAGFLTQLRMFEQMHCQLDEANVRFRLFKLTLAAERMRKAKILFKDTLDNIIDPDPIHNEERGASWLWVCCKHCRRLLSTSSSLLPHLESASPSWRDAVWSLDKHELSPSGIGSQVCRQSIFVNPLQWMQTSIKQHLTGHLHCPQCRESVGDFSWVLGMKCDACKAFVVPAFKLEVTSVVCLTDAKHLRGDDDKRLRVPIFV